MALDYRWYKSMSYDKKVELGYYSPLSQGTMPITKMCEDDEELKAYKKNVDDWIEFKKENNNG